MPEQVHQIDQVNETDNIEQIAIKNISKHFVLDDQTLNAVDNVTLSIKKGEFVSIVGHSGSGKTTLLSMMGGILSPTIGTMHFDGTDVFTLNEDDLSAYRANTVGYMFQFSSLMPVLTARENLLLPTLFGSLKGDPTLEDKALEYLSLVGLDGKANALPGQLSGGQQRRVAIARALMNDPEMILADEPTGDLDEETEADIMELLHKVNKESNITFVLVTHSSELAARAERRLSMSHGKLVELVKEQV
jgi:putative ABC transport system ATP-binding protein/lipoprotein-releasing system ATP-binding protein